MRPRRLVPGALVGALILAVVVAPSASASPGQAVNDKTSIALEEIVSTLAGPGVSVSNVSYAGDDRAVGIFAGMSSIGIEGGVVLSTGTATSALPGPNTDPRGTTRFDTPGDAELDALIGDATVDASAIEFDFVPRSDSVSIDYVFGSEEYNMFVGSAYNDAFALFVNGQNCAVIDGAPVSINTINGTARPDLFVDNTDASVDTALNGFTRPLRCTTPVRQGVVNHAKLVIGDVADSRYDSTVLIAGGGFYSNRAPTAGDLSFTMTSGATASVAFPGADDEEDELTYSIDSAPAHGEVESTEDGVTYTPAAGFVGTDTFTFTVSDGVTVSDPYTVTIVVSPPVPADSAPVNSAPVVAHVTYTVVQGEQSSVPVVAIDADGDELTYEIVEPTAHGTLSGKGRAFSYRSAEDFVGVDGFTVRVVDSAEASGVGHVTLDVVARPVPPIVSGAMPVFPNGARASLGTLPSTGVDAGPAIVSALVLVGAGAGLIALTRIRRRARRS
ncbi:choice-of-anchor L domain-containing protein [Leifsonia sp. NPDC058248]|uniref:choice-of-anchor L domain-containing protein n=1 Tax=Leifsonia sp. NPDC058248 TaxID=3346402 RepID=UPI0036DAF026